MALSKLARVKTVSAEFVWENLISVVVKCVETSVLSTIPIFRTARDAPNSLERNSMEDFQTPLKKQKTADSTSGKENKQVSKKGLSLKGKEKAKPEDCFSE